MNNSNKHDHTPKSNEAIEDLSDLDLQLYKDLTMRARGGIVIYSAVWLITAVWVGMAEHTPLFFYGNLCLFSVIIFSRLIHYVWFRKNTSYKPKQMYYLLVGLILFGALHWGAMSAWVIFMSPYDQLHYPYMIILASFAMGGTAVLSISFITAFLYPLFIFLPTIILGMIVTVETAYDVLGLLALFATIYVLEASRVSRRDYMSAITNQKKAEERAAQMEKLSITDPLTGLYNRQYFEAKFTEELSRCSRFRIPLSIFILDIDNFKSINDNYGHTAGDACLQQIGLTLKAQVPRITDSVVRYGGDEFIILLPGADQTIASKMAESLRIAIKDISPQWNEGSSISCSLGAATYVPPPKTTGEKILKAADDALYQAKRLGRNRCCFDKSLAKLKVLASEDRTILNS